MQRYGGGAENKPEIDYCKVQMDMLRHRTDDIGIKAFNNAQRQYLGLLDHQNAYWKQRAKAFWLKEGDTNSKFFHNLVKSRRKNNSINKLRDAGGNLEI